MHLILAGVGILVAALLSSLALGVSWWWGLAFAVTAHLILMLGLLHPSPSFICRTMTCGPGGEVKSTALTFDDGPDPQVTPRVLRILQEKRVRATFFCIGRHARLYPQLVRAIVEAGHEIGNHSYSHPRHIYAWSARALLADTRLAQRAIRRACDREPIWYRPPIGFRNLLMSRVLKTCGLSLVNFTFRTFDTRATSAEKIVRRVLSRTVPGAIIVLHDGTDRQTQPDRSALLAALPVLIDRLREQGYQFCLVSDLLAPRPLAVPESAPAPS